MILRITYRVEKEEDIARSILIKNVRVHTRKDVNRIERYIENKFGYEKVHISNWKILGSVGDKIGDAARKRGK